MDRLKELLYKKYKRGEMNEESLYEAIGLMEKYDREKEEKLSYNSLYLNVGVAFLLSSILYFVAYNWQDISDLAKISGIVVLMLPALVLYLIKLGDRYRNLALFSLAFLVGVLFALVGQIYQTGADTYNLFLMWSVLIIPMVYIGRYTPLDILFFITSTLTLTLFISEYITLIYLPIYIVGFLLLVLLLVDSFFYNKRSSKAIKLLVFSTLVLQNFVVNPFIFYRNDSYMLLLLVYGAFVGYIYSKNLLYSKNQKLLSLIPLFTYIPCGSIYLFIELEVYNHDILWALTLNIIVIIALYTFLIREIKRIRGKKDD